VREIDGSCSVVDCRPGGFAAKRLGPSAAGGKRTTVAASTTSAVKASIASPKRRTSPASKSGGLKPAGSKWQICHGRLAFV
jgi:hypothetical protein